MEPIGSGGNALQWFTTVLLSAGAATFIWTVTRSYLAIKGRVDTREDRALERMEEHEESAREELAHERKWGAYWFRRAAMLEAELIRHGIVVPPAAGPEPYRGLSPQEEP